jgi:peroxiredoxin
MSAVRTTLWPGLLLVILLIVALPLCLSAAVAAGDKAPDFKLDNVDGKSTVTLSDYTDKPTLLVFWASWCPHCQREVSVLQKVYSDLGPKGMNAIGTSVDEDSKKANEFVGKHKLTFPNAFAGTDAGSAVLDSYGVDGVPAIFVLGKGGVTQVRFDGETEEKAIREEFAKLGVK